MRQLLMAKPKPTKPTSPYKSGKTWEKEVDESCRNFIATCSGAAWFWRVPDSVAYGRNSKEDARHRVPSDHFMLHDGKFYGIEEKSSTSKKGYLLRYVRPHQVESLLEIERAGGKGVFLIAKRTPENTTEKVWAVPASKMKNLFDNGVKRVDWDQFDTLGESLPITRRRVRIVVEMGAVVD